MCSACAFTYLCKVKGLLLYDALNLVVLACLSDPFVYTGMATGTEGAECFAFAPFNMQP